MSSLKTTNSPPIVWRLRDDLQIESRIAGTTTYSTIKDPLRLTYFHAESEEMGFLKLLDGRRSLGSVIEALQKQFPACEFSEENLRLFLVSAINGGILRCCVPGHSNRINEMRKRQADQALFRRMLSLLTYRFRGIDPTQLLNRLDSLLGWIYQPKFMLAGAVLLGVAALMIFARFDQIAVEMPGFNSLLTATNISILVLSLIFVKVLHELGHGLTCRHFGGECHELGVLVIGFMPLLYCDVSDSWLQLDRRKRMLVAAAGIGAELLVASASAILWAYSRPGVLHSFFLNVTVISSLNTLLVNGNPLLKYDGYYVLSDWCRIPNLSSESKASFVGLLDRVILGLNTHPQTGRTYSGRCLISLYGGASLGYRTIMLVSLLWVIHQTLKTWNLEAITGVLVASVVAGFLITGVRGVRERMRLVSGNPEHHRRASVGVLTSCLLLILIATIPFPYYVEAPFTFTPGLSSPVFAIEDGSIQRGVSVGAIVTNGDIIAVQRNSDLDSEMAQAEGELRLAETRASNLGAQRSSNSEAANALPSAEKAVQSRTAKVKMLQKKQGDLTIVSPADGLVYAPRNRPRLPNQTTGEGTWFGEPLSPENGSAWIGRQTLLCWVGQPCDLRAFCVIAEQDIELIEFGASVSLVFSSMPSRPLQGHVSQRKEIPESSIERELVSNRLVAVRSLESARPVATMFGVSVALEEGSQLPPLYSTGFAKIRCTPVSILRRGWRFICHTFSFER